MHVLTLSVPIRLAGGMRQQLKCTRKGGCLEVSTVPQQVLLDGWRPVGARIEEAGISGPKHSRLLSGAWP